MTDMAVPTQQRSGHKEALSKHEQATVSAICSRVVRVLGLQDCEGLRQDIVIVQSNCPIDLDALAAAPDKVFMDELLTIVDSTDRTTGSLKASFYSRFMLDAPTLTLV
ncbi:hypothetical protein R0135_11625 [Congregibacter variabilis]|uniref:DUF6874 domain-containing protein n=1 Tax=Congregibacter variabilis TaxID=3081200 RepID=A0ABZ0I062_9GAMM|nr:hypothetical protein R0135_11625 [Congregibacter sp. IMCC43200]